MAMSLMEAHQGPRVALGHSFGTPPRGRISMSSRDWHLSSHKGQWSFYDMSLPCGGIMTLGYYYDLSKMNAGEHSHEGSFGYLSCFPRVPIRCRTPSGSTL
jgi:hypothetical protein